tara:strand:+ start:280 stop:594 length:315 start_codon:yes stop_codon:yes gene_type:complete
MFFNVTGSNKSELIAPGSGIDVKLVHITNLHSTDDVLVDLYISTISQNTTEADDYYLMKGYKIEQGGFLNLESKVLSFNNRNSSGFGLFIKLNKADSDVDIIIK